MYETHTAVVGTVITDPRQRTTSSGDVVLSFRMACNGRRLDRETGEWHDNGTLYLSVSCWRRLVIGVGASLTKGDPVIAYGQLRTNEYTTKDGAPRSDLEMRASAVGPDLARCIAPLARGRKAAVLVGESRPDGEVGETAQDPSLGQSSTFGEPTFGAMTDRDHAVDDAAAQPSQGEELEPVPA
ncbi:single-stranded DNA-binding protein [Speluncibacter jeojiensis]|uniref:Single-stranded DNA-binding protein n=1 Tax=Speluncibacter jeojiensis TaxID=2710754 RepID=A0A9X4M142_9ACTN|nr:single-stranded DNA-binding protein [Corynebacteriales bacterium D3-21]